MIENQAFITLGVLVCIGNGKSEYRKIAEQRAGLMEEALKAAEKIILRDAA